MSLQQSSIRDIGFRDAAFALVWVLSFVLLLPIQLVTMIVFDATGLDTIAPDLVFMAVVPAVALTVLPTLVARHLYTRRATYISAVVAFATFTLVSGYLMQFYGLCGPGC